MFTKTGVRKPKTIIKAGLPAIQFSSVLKWGALACLPVLCLLFGTADVSSVLADEKDAPKSGPVSILEKEHSIIRKLAGVAEQTGRSIRDDHKVDAGQVEKLHDFFTNFADRCHHAKEEDELFPALRKLDVDPTILDLLLTQHQEGRILLAGIRTELDELDQNRPKAGLDALGQYLVEYAKLMYRHIDTENEYLWPKATRHLDPSDQRSLVNAFERIETEELGVGFHEKYHAMAMELLSSE